MQLPNRPLLNSKPVTKIAAPKISGLNRQTYQRMKLALSLDLRRQIFVGVCDDLPLRDLLAAHLQAELGYPLPEEQTEETPEPLLEKSNLPGIVSLRLNLRHPNPIAQIVQWFAQHPALHNTGTSPGFQVLGVERLTRQQPALQWSFLSYLRDIERTLPTLESNLLLWVPRPWLRSIQESAPEFWSWRTGVFEFEGDPKPATPSDNHQGTPQNRAASKKKATLSANLKAQPPSQPDRQRPPRRQPQPQESSQTAQTPIDHSHFILDPADFGNTHLEDELELNHSVGAIDSANPKIHEPLLSPPPPHSPDKKQLITQSLGFKLQPSDFSRLKQESKTVAELVDLVLASATQEAGWDGELKHSPPIQSLQTIEQLHRQPQAQAALASAYQSLGDIYRTRIEQGDATQQNLTIAIRAYEQMLEFQDAASPQVPDILNDLGNLYWMLSRYVMPAEQKLPYLELGIHAYHAALMNINPQTQPQSYAMIQNNLGAVYGDLARYREPAENLHQSVLAYQEALRYRRWEVDNPNTGTPAQYASTLNNLGTAYWNLAQHQQPIPNLKQAISAYNEALRYYSPDRQPLDYAMIQNNLGTAYWNLAQYEQPEDYLLLAISAYQIALGYRTADAMPAACAATQNNLGTAYWHLANQAKNKPVERFEFLQHAISAYEAALNVAQQLAAGTKPLKTLSFDIFSTHNNLGLAHYQIATDQQVPMDKASRSAHLDTALHHHLQALQGWQQQPDFYQTAMSFVVQTIRAFYAEGGFQAQNTVLSKIPGQLLPEIMRRL
ncbi:tetratricopeptide repeat protein [Microcoleus sp. FACHB-672]|uniref:tetratricopeptide repeat protein n=1 Tax=Microcoleus sp. FACHB-672 TaxID=2692825 RepID=UPI002815585D|nr:tetratricopeptide repeat protein [Microcoleus sp. FACHB-672]